MRTIKRQQIRRLREAWTENYPFRTLLSAALSLCSTILFALYHGFLGVALSSVWHGGVCRFYLLLVMLRGTILLTESRLRNRTEAERQLWRRRVFHVTSALLLMLNLALIFPIAFMALLQRPISMGQIPAIAMAAYTTYKITMAVVHVRRREASPVLIRELRTINLIDALVSILTLQNTLIMVNTDAAGLSAMRKLSVISSGAIYLLILAITIRLILSGGGQMRRGAR